MRRKPTPVFVTLADLEDAQYPGLRAGRAALGLDPDETPIEPVREIELRHDRRARRFRPCPKGNGSTVAHVDAAGRVVLALYPLDRDPFDAEADEPVAWVLAVPTGWHDPGEVVTFLAAEAARRRKQHG